MDGSSQECNKYGYTIDGVSIPSDKVGIDNNNHYGEKEKENKKEKEIQNKKEEQKEVKNENVDQIRRFSILYEQNVGLINGIVGEWLFEISQTIDYDLFKKAVEIATDKGKCNRGYIKGIISQWSDNNIHNLDELKAFEIGIKNRGEIKNAKYKSETRESKYATEHEKENEGLYRKPTDAEIEAVKRDFELFKSKR